MLICDNDCFELLATFDEITYELCEYVVSIGDSITRVADCFSSGSSIITLSDLATTCRQTYCIQRNPEDAICWCNNFFFFFFMVVGAPAATLYHYSVEKKSIEILTTVYDNKAPLLFPFCPLPPPPRPPCNFLCF